MGANFADFCMLKIVEYLHHFLIEKLVGFSLDKFAVFELKKI